MSGFCLFSWGQQVSRNMLSVANRSFPDGTPLFSMSSSPAYRKDMRLSSLDKGEGSAAWKKWKHQQQKAQPAERWALHSRVYQVSINGPFPTYTEYLLCEKWHWDNFCKNAVVTLGCPQDHTGFIYGIPGSGIIDHPWLCRVNNRFGSGIQVCLGLQVWL